MNKLDSIIDGLLDRNFKACRDMIAPSNITDRIRIAFTPDHFLCSLRTTEKVNPNKKQALVTLPDFVLPIEGGFSENMSFCEPGEVMFELELPDHSYLLYVSEYVLFDHFEILNWDDEAGVLAKWTYRQLERRGWRPRIKRDDHGMAEHRIINNIGLNVTFEDGAIRMIASTSNSLRVFDLNYPDSLAVFEKYLDSMMLVHSTNGELV